MLTLLPETAYHCWTLAAWSVIKLVDPSQSNLWLAYFFGYRLMINFADIEDVSGHGRSPLLVSAHQTIPMWGELGLRIPLYRWHWCFYPINCTSLECIRWMLKTALTAPPDAGKINWLFGTAVGKNKDQATTELYGNKAWQFSIYSLLGLKA